MKRVIIDCDPSADDALALMLAAASAELSLEAVTAVSGVCEVVQSARNALNILELCGRSDVSVAAGASQPLKRRLEFDGKYCGCDGLSETGLVPASSCLSRLPAVELIHRKLEEHPGEIYIISIAPMTNLAELLMKYPESRGQIAGIYTINGSYGVAPDKSSWNPRPSWNVRTDPEAAKYVIESGIPVTALGLDVTMRLENAMAERLIAEGTKNGWAFQFLERAVAFNLKRGLEPYSLLVDAMAVAAAVRPEIAEYIHGKAAVSDQDGLMCGQTLFGAKGYADQWNSDVWAAYCFDFDIYIDLFLERVFS